MAEPMVLDERLDASPIIKGGTHRPRLKGSKPSRPYLDWLLRHQIQIALMLISGVVSLHNLHLPSRTFTRKLLHLSYGSQAEGTYNQGIDDVYFVFAWAVNFTALRAISIEWVLQPLAKYCGVGKKYHLRFAEQGWLVMYYGTFWILGMHFWINSPYWMNNSAIWVSWPAREMAGTFKWYCLVQLAFWVQQILVIHMEARRKDHAQMLTHHFITCTLVSVAYVYRFTRATNVVLCLMDIVDVIFPLAKILKYLRHETACNITFGLFVVTWFISRHIMYLTLCYDLYMHVPSPSTMQYGCYSGRTYELLPDIPAHPDYFSHLLWPFQDVDRICLNVEVKWIFLVMLGLLQILSLIWFGMILKVIAGIVMGGQAEDIRSGDEESEDEDEQTVENMGNAKTDAERRQKNMTELNACVGVASEYNTSNGGVSTLSGPKAKPTSARRRLMDAENRKEFLARIGCEKPM